MSNFENLKKTFNELGIGFSVSENKTGKTIQLEKGQEKVNGYRGFKTDFKFEPDGIFTEALLYEGL